MEREWESQFNEMGIRMEQWMQKLEDKIKGQIFTLIQGHQSDRKERGSKRNETIKLEKPTPS